MKKYLLFFVSLHWCSSVFSQSNIYPLKENYDEIYNNYAPANINYTDHEKTGNQLSWVLMSLIRMYEATNDKPLLAQV